MTRLRLSRQNMARLRIRLYDYSIFHFKSNEFADQMIRVRKRLNQHDQLDFPISIIQNHKEIH